MLTRSLCLTLLALTLLSACASVERFRTLTPAQRAREVCTGIDSYTELDSDEREQARKAADIRQVLERGYRLHESCRTVESSKAPDIPCPSSASRSGDARCSKEQNGKYKRICRDIPVPIDGALEKEKLAEHDAQARARASEKNRLYQRCYAEVLPMSAEQAYDYYKQH